MYNDQPKSSPDEAMNVTHETELSSPMMKSHHNTSSSEFYHQLYKIHDTSTVDIMTFLLATQGNKRIAHRKEDLIFENKSARKMGEADRKKFHSLYEEELNDIMTNIDDSGFHSYDLYREEANPSNNYRMYGFAGEGVSVCVLTVADNINTCIVYYCLNQDKHDYSNNYLKQRFEGLITKIKKFEKEVEPIKEEGSKVHLLKSSNGHLYFEEVDFHWQKHPNADIEDFYEEDFDDIKRHVLSELDKEKNPGLVLLHGKHGTGKTTFMKIVIEETDKAVLFLPPQITKNITMPDLIDTITSTFKEPIVLVEDAEALLKKRQADDSSMSVSNMLNLGDGILGNIYNMKFVCTFNCSIEDIDEAARRPGRLIAEYQFDDLSEERTKNLYHKLHGADKTPPKKKMSIAEIINDQEKKAVKESEKISFGFIEKS